MTFHEDPDLENRLRRIAASPQPPVPDSVMRYAGEVTGKKRGSIMRFSFASVFGAGRSRLLPAFGVIGAVVIAAVLANLVLTARGQTGGSLAPSGSAGPTGSPTAISPTIGTQFTTPGVSTGWKGLTWSPLSAAAGVQYLTKWSGGYLATGSGYGGTQGPTTALWSSADGRTWTETSAAGSTQVVVAAAPAGLVAIAVAPTQSLLMGFGSAKSVYTSADGLTWQSAGTPNLPGTLLSLAGTDKGILAVVDTSPRAMASPSSDAATRFPSIRIDVYFSTDGIHWTTDAVDPSVTGNLSEIGNFPGAVAHVQSDGGRFFLLATEPLVSTGQTQTTSHVWWSDDGRNWTRSGGSFSHCPSYIDFARDGMLLHTTCLGYPDGVLGQAYSTDGGKTWNPDDAISPLGALACQGSCVGRPDGAFGSNGTVIVAIKKGGRQAWTSTDGHTWSPVAWGGADPSQAIGGAVAGFVVMPHGVLVNGSYGAASDTPTATPSPSVAPGPTMIATGFTTPGSLTGWTGFDWSPISDKSPLRSPITDVVKWRGGYVATSAYLTGGPAIGIWSSPDGQAWTPVTAIHSSAAFVAAAPGGLIAIAVPIGGPNTPGDVWTSSDGVTWHDAGKSDLPGDLLSLAGTSAGIVATTDVVSGIGTAKGKSDMYTVMFSTDGLHWVSDTPSGSTQTSGVPHVQAGNGRFFLMGVPGPLVMTSNVSRVVLAASTTPVDAILWSDDGRTWTQSGGSYTDLAQEIQFGRDGMLLRTQSNAIPGGSGMARSTDGGKTWIRDDTFGPLGVAPCMGECSVGADGQIVANGTYFMAVKADGKSAWLSLDGHTWTPVAWAGGDPSLGSIFLMPRGVVALNYGAAK